MSFFIGWTFSATFIPRISDLYGRKLATIGTMILQTAAIIVMNFSTSVYLTQFLMFLFGMACVGTRSIQFLYLMELLPEKWQVPIGTTLNLWDTLVPVLYTLYYWQIGKDWKWFVLIFAEITGVVIIAVTFFLPESPKFLISKKRFDDARKTINFFKKGN